MLLFFASFSIFSLQIGLCLFGYYESEKLKSGEPYVLSFGDSSGNNESVR